MGESASLSVALCTHNGARYLPDQLRSILEQSAPVAEVIVSDDASRDTTVEVVRRFAGDAIGTLRVELSVNDPALGVTKNFESALRRVSGDVVLLCDQDDLWDPRKASVLSARLDGRRPQLVFTDAVIIDAAGRPTGETLFGNLRIAQSELTAVDRGRALQVLLRRNIVTGATAAVTRELVDSALPIPESWVHDEWLAVTAAIVGDVLLEPRTLTSYRLHGANEIGATRLGLRAMIGRLTEPRATRNGRLLDRARSLDERFGSDSSVDASVRAMIQAKLAHEEARSAYPGSRIRRVGPVIRRWRTGSYRRFGLGVQDAVRDLLQPA
ncbi:glycosyltransferase family 2 protein [Leifsonia aquatica]|uniref:glycosyltransferase family 2 protein n=1 Tax=Leifsonia aquatica TaxID=144185 RepID=UPI0038103B95